MNSPKVSIVVPVYNCEKFISKCLESIISQSYKNIEIILVNDGSSDDSEKIIKNYQERDKRIVYFFQDNSGPSEARNKGIMNSTGEYLVFIDSDDTVEEVYVELLVNKIINSKVDIVCCGYKEISRHGNINYTDFNFEGNIPKHSFIEMVCKGTGGVLWGKIFKRNIITQNELAMDKHIFMSEDLIFVLQYVYYCKTFAAIKQYLYNYNRLNEASISSNISMEYISNHIKVCKILEEILYSLSLDQHKINQIISSRVQSLVLNLVEQQSKNLNVLGIKSSIENVKYIIISTIFGKI